MLVTAAVFIAPLFLDVSQPAITMGEYPTLTRTIIYLARSVAPLIVRVPMLS